MTKLAVHVVEIFAAAAALALFGGLALGWLIQHSKEDEPFESTLFLRKKA